MYRDNRDGIRGARVREPAVTDIFYISLYSLSILLRRIVAHLPNQEANKIILDLGCGDKPYQPFFAGQYDSYIGVDINSKTLCDVNATADHLPFKDCVFDVCMCLQSYEHMADPQEVTREVCRVLNKTGFFIMSTHAVAAVHDYPVDYWRWTDQGLRLLLGSYFSNILVHNVTDPIETLFQLVVTYLPTNKLGLLIRVFLNKTASSIGKALINRTLPRLVADYLVTAERSKN